MLLFGRHPLPRGYWPAKVFCALLWDEAQQNALISELNNSFGKYRNMLLLSSLSAVTSYNRFKVLRQEEFIAFFLNYHYVRLDMWF